jgi:transcriptional regulator with XRE-family HTH domain
MKQPAVARLEAGEQNPNWETLTRISDGLGVEFLVDIAPKGKRPGRQPPVRHAG